MWRAPRVRQYLAFRPPAKRQNVRCAHLQLLMQTKEDKELKARLDAALEQIQSTDEDEVAAAVDILADDIRKATSSMTSVPKPLKFLSPHYDTLREIYTSMEEYNPVKAPLADVLSVLGMVKGAHRRDTLRYCLLGTGSDIGKWGHEYLRHLAGEVGSTFEELTTDDPDADVSDLMRLVDAIVPYNMEHNAEAEAVDLLLEVGALVSLPSSGFIDEHNCTRVCEYLLQCASYLGDAEEVWEVLEVAFELYMQQHQYPNALRTALRLGSNSGAGMTEDDTEDEVRRDVVQIVKRKLARVFKSCPSHEQRAQMALMLGRHHAQFDFEEDLEDAEVPSGESHAVSVEIDDEEVEKLQELSGNGRVSEFFGVLCRELDMTAPKTPEDIYKSHLSETASTALRQDDGSAQVESARGNLASTYVNAFVNAASGQDKLMTPEDSTWLSRNKDDAKLAVAASVGMLHLWNEDEISAADKFLHAADENVRAGGLLALGLIGTGLTSDTDPVYAVLSEYLDTTSSTAGVNDKPVTNRVKASSIFALGVAYSGTGREDVAELLYPYLQDAEHGMELATHAALSLGFILAGTGAELAAAVIVDRLMVASAIELQHPLVKHAVLGLGLLFLGQGDAYQATAEMLQALPQVAAEGKYADAEEKFIASFKPKGSAEDADASGDGEEADKSMGDIQEDDAEGGEDKPQNDRATMLAVDTPAHNLERFARVVLQACAFAGTGNVLVTQKLLHLAAEHPESEALAAQEAAKDTGDDVDAEGAAGGAAAGAAASGAGDDSAAPKDDKSKVKPAYLYQGASVLGLALVAIGEHISVDMLTRTAEHLLQYGDAAVKRAVPLALALAHASDPAYAIVDVLGKLAHDQDKLVAQSAVFALGVVGAGTNNSRIAGILRQLSSFFAKEANLLFVTRLAQGMLHAGKGLVSVAPLHSDRLLMAPAVVSSLLTLLVTMLDAEHTLHGRYHYLMYSVAAAMHPRSIITVDADMKPVKVEVRVGQAVETVGQAGRPKRITGFQTHTSPVLLAAGERAELADQDQWEAMTSVIEGVVVLKKKQ